MYFPSDCIISGRFDDVFVEQRRRALERFLQRASQHPVIGPSPAFKHFLVTSDYQVCCIDEPCV